MTNEKLSIPNQVFKWFEKMKSNYERNIVSVLDRFERTTKEHQQRVDNLHANTIDSLEDAHAEVTASQQKHIEQLQQDIKFYQAQVLQQQATIDQLNQRYDAVFSKLLIDSQTPNCEKDITTELSRSTNQITEDENFITKLLSEPTSSVVATKPNDVAENQQEYYFEKAMQHRQRQEYTQAIEYFEKAAQMAHPNAMGALGRAYFLAEGVEENPIMGLHWLIKAAEHGLPQAISRVEYYKENEPDLYYLATTT